MTEQVALSIGAYNSTNNPINNVGVNKINTDKASTNKESVNNKSSDTNKVINNQATSLYQFGQPKATDYPQALQTINQWWQTKLTTPPPHLSNGSGLCRDCTISAANLSELLTYAYEQPSFDAYVSSLGIAGVSGTISAHKGRSGQDYVVVGMINTDQALNAYNARTVLDTMLDWTAQH